MGGIGAPVRDPTPPDEWFSLCSNCFIPFTLFLTAGAQRSNLFTSDTKTCVVRDEFHVSRI